MYRHGITVTESSTNMVTPITGNAGLQVVFGTAPVNLAQDPYAAVDKLFLINNMAEAKANLGYSEDFENYTLCQSMDASFLLYNIAPVILCNVLDPKKHKKANPEETLTFANGQCTLETKGVLLDTLEIKIGASELLVDTDYIATFSDNGNVLITLLNETQGTLTVASASIDPTAVTETDVIGGVDVTTGTERGMELVRQVYPRFGITTGLLLAPGWSHKPSVAGALVAKSQEINGVFKVTNIIDLDTTIAKDRDTCKALKEEYNLTDKTTILTWPQVQTSTKKYYYSAVYAASVAYLDAQNDDVPNLSPSNKLINISKTMLVDGTEVVLDQVKANELNALGIVTALNNNGWRSWGNNMACYPNITDPKDRWICCRRFFTWWANGFILRFSDKVDELTNYRLIESIIDSENTLGNSYTSQGKCAGIRIEFNEEENSIENILDGKIRFKQYLSPYTPAEQITNDLEFDTDMIREALGGE